METNQFMLGALSVILIFFEVVAIVAVIKAQNAAKAVESLRKSFSELSKRLEDGHYQLAAELDRARSIQREEISQKFYEAERNLREHIKFVEDSIKESLKKPAKKSSGRTKSLYS